VSNDSGNIRNAEERFIRKLDKRLCEEYDYWINERLGTLDYVPVGVPLNKKDPIKAKTVDVELDIKDVKDE
jgi:hypothetical protein